MKKYIERLREMLGDASAEVRHNAARALIENGEKVPLSILAEMVASGDYRLCLAAIRALPDYQEEAIPVLKEAVITGGLDVQKRAIEVLVSIISPKSVDALWEIAQKENFGVVGLRGMVALADNSRKKKADLAALVVKRITDRVIDIMHHHPVYDTRVIAARVLGRVGNADATPVLLSALAKEKRVKMKNAILFALAAVGLECEEEKTRERVREVIEKALASQDVETRRSVVTGLSLPQEVVRIGAAADDWIVFK